MNRELIALRTWNDDLQNRFATIESFLDRQGLRPFDLAFSNKRVSRSSRSNVLADASSEGDLTDSSSRKRGGECDPYPFRALGSPR